jgi:hypothetical protein
MMIDDRQLIYRCLDSQELETLSWIELYFFKLPFSYEENVFSDEALFFELFQLDFVWSTVNSFCGGRGGYLKCHAFYDRPKTLDDLKENVWREIDRIQIEMLQQVNERKRLLKEDCM